jgi:hypothetical protein
MEAIAIGWLQAFGDLVLLVLEPSGDISGLSVLGRLPRRPRHAELNVEIHRRSSSHDEGSPESYTVMD